ncbi:hypothetical protein H4R20_006698, partial [Coemansia guatemalensis]
MSDDVTNHQTNVPDVQYDDSEAWMEYDADAIMFAHEDDDTGYWPAPSRHHVQIVDQTTDLETDKQWHLSEFDWGAEPLEPRLAAAIGVTEYRSLAVMGLMTNPVFFAVDKCQILLFEYPDPVAHCERVAHIMAPGSTWRGEDMLKPPEFYVHMVATDGSEASEVRHNGFLQMDCAKGDVTNAELVAMVHMARNILPLLNSGALGPVAAFAAYGM